VRVEQSGLEQRPVRQVPVADLYVERIPSRDGSTMHTVRQLGDGSWECDCAGASYGQRADGGCRHIDEAKARHGQA